MATMPSATRIPVAQFSQMSCLVRMMLPPGSSGGGAHSPVTVFANDNHSHLMSQVTFSGKVRVARQRKAGEDVAAEGRAAVEGARDFAQERRGFGNIATVLLPRCWDVAGRDVIVSVMAHTGCDS
jgi:hypothetical protein